MQAPAGAGGSSASPIERAEQAIHVGLPRKTAYRDEDIFEWGNPRIKEDVLRMVLQYLQDEGYPGAMGALQEEAKVRVKELVDASDYFKAIRKAILDGEWAEVEKLVQKSGLKEHTQFQYSIYKQQFLEFIDHMDFQKAFTLLSKQLKPLEPQLGPLQAEFRELCYMLTCKTVQEAPAFRSWEGVSASREKLVTHISAMLSLEEKSNPLAPSVLPEVPPQRLQRLLHQAVRYQIEFSRYHPKLLPRIKTLLSDYSCFVLPNACKATFRGHRQNVKCVDFVGPEGDLLVSGSSDNSVRIWSVVTGRCVRVLGGSEAAGGHSSRVWDVAAMAGSADIVASASGDGTVRVWDIRKGRDERGGSSGDQEPVIGGASTACLRGHEGDVYTVAFHPSNSKHVATGGYDRAVRLWDVAAGGTVVRTLLGHHASISRVVFNPHHRSLLVTGSKDSTIKFWDLLTGMCVNTFSAHLGEVTSVELNDSGSLLLSGSKDNSNRLWDLRMGKPLQRFKGHQNTSKNFVRASFGPNEDLVVGGSEDGFVYVWDAATGEILQRLGSLEGEEGTERGHVGVVYRAVWSGRQSLLASCSHDGTLKTWWYDKDWPLVCDALDPFTS